MPDERSVARATLHTAATLAEALGISPHLFAQRSGSTIVPIGIGSHIPATNSTDILPSRPTRVRIFSDASCDRKRAVCSAALQKQIAELQDLRKQIAELKHLRCRNVGASASGTNAPRSDTAFGVRLVSDSPKEPPTPAPP